MLEDTEALLAAVQTARPDMIIPLAAQTRMSYSIENSRTYLNANIAGTFKVLEAALTAEPAHLRCP